MASQMIATVLLFGRWLVGYGWAAIMYPWWLLGCCYVAGDCQVVAMVSQMIATVLLFCRWLVGRWWAATMVY